MRSRVLGMLAVARSFGDHGLKQFVSARPVQRAAATRSTRSTPTRPRRASLCRSHGRRGSHAPLRLTARGGTCRGARATPPDHERLTAARVPEPACVRPYLVDIELTPDCPFLIMACDGLWDVMTDQEACDFVAKAYIETAKEDQVAKDLMREALNRGTTDNVTVMVIYFNKMGK